MMFLILINLDSDTLIVFKKFTILDDIDKNENEEQIAVIGNSTAFGVGASSDKKTISSYLTNFSNKKSL